MPKLRKPALRSWGPDFCVFRRQPFVLTAVELWGGRRYVTFSVVLAAFVGVPAGIALVEGTLFGTALSATDVRNLLSGKGLAGASEISYIRDYANLGLQVLLAAHAAHMVAQWIRVSRLPTLLRKRGLIPDTSIDEATFHRVLDKYEHRFNRRLLEAIAATAGVVLTALLALAVVSNGIYPQFREQGLTGSDLSGWWADPNAHPVAFGALVATYWFHLYLFIRHTLMGVVALRLVRDARGLAGPTRPWLAYPSSPWVDVQPAVQELRSALNDVLTSILLLVSVFLVAAIYVPLPDFLIYGFVVPFVVVLNPLFLIVPSVELNRQIENSWHILRSHTLALWSNALARAREADARHATQEWLRAEACRMDYERAVILPRLVIDWWALARDLVIYLIPLAALLPVIV